jgi:hypothetical protein
MQDLMAQTRQEVRQHAEERTHQAAGGLRTLSEQVAALAHGRPEQAGSLPGYLEDAQHHVQRWSSRLEEAGPQGIIDDLTRLARRRPGMFLAGAVGAGFLVGRMFGPPPGRPRTWAPARPRRGGR